MIGKFKKYKKYKPTGIEWLGEIPSHWEILLIRRITKEHKQGFYSPDGYKDDGYRLIRITDLDAFGNINISNSPFVQPIKDEIEIFSIKIGDVLFPRTGSIGLVGVAKNNLKAVFASYLIRFRFHQNAFVGFLKYFFMSKPFLNGVFSDLHGGVNQNIHAENIKNQWLGFPPKNEQKTIAKFLDEKTKQIDNFIQLKEKTIALLQERKAAIISQAVTKGLDPNVPMKDSGIEWLGEIPEHWEVKKLKYLTKILRGKFTHRPRNDESLYGGKYPFIQTGDVSKAGKYVETYKQTLNELGYRVTKEFPKGTLVMTIAASVGEVAILNFTGCFPDSIVGFYPQSESSVDFLYYNFTILKQRLFKESTLNTQLNLNVDRIGNIFTVAPPKIEQLAIVKFIEKKVNKLRLIAEETQKEITLIKEYRASLISAAVTGKIDVRAYQKNTKKPQTVFAEIDSDAK